MKNFTKIFNEKLQLNKNAEIVSQNIYDLYYKNADKFTYNNVEIIKIDKLEHHSHNLNDNNIHDILYVMELIIDELNFNNFSIKIKNCSNFIKLCCYINDSFLGNIIMFIDSIKNKTILNGIGLSYKQRNELLFGPDDTTKPFRDKLNNICNKIIINLQKI